jgi:hypothetical protein
MKPNRIFIAVLLLLLMAFQPLCADPRGRGGDRERGQEDVSAGQAADRVRKETGGRVLSVEEGGNGYRVRVLTPKGEVRAVPVPRGR